jgi:hypothetical protein
MVDNKILRMFHVSSSELLKLYYGDGGGGPLEQTKIVLCFLPCLNFTLKLHFSVSPAGASFKCYQC